ncbi:MAG: response regulator [Acidobacteriota bacterium]
MALRVLVIDDDAGIRDVLRMTLTYDGYQIVGAATGHDGLALADRDPPDLVLLDVEMPGMGGLDVLSRLHAAHEKLPVVMMSAHGSTVVAAAARAAGAVDFLEKPFESTDRLRTTIHDAIEHAALASES